MDYFGKNSKNRQRWAIHPSDLRLDSMTGKCTKPNEHVWMIQMLENLKAKLNGGSIPQHFH